MLRYTLFTEQHNCCNPIASDVQRLLEKMVFGFFKKSGPSPEEEKKFQGAFFRRLINEDREKNNEEKIVDHCVLAGNFVFNDVMNAAAVWKHRKDLENDWSRFELAILFIFLRVTAKQRQNYLASTKCRLPKFASKHRQNFYWVSAVHAPTSAWTHSLQILR